LESYPKPSHANRKNASTTLLSRYKVSVLTRRECCVYHLKSNKKNLKPPQTNMIQNLNKKIKKKEE